jgi:energy-coupling factor transporter ATP-binding protein EcfA2
MYLHGIDLKNWGCHPELTLQPTPGLNVCLGANGAGKSTLYRAIVAALTHKHTSKNQEEVGLFESWGLDGFGPTVTLGLTRPDGRWCLRKTYLHKPACLLEHVSENGGEPLSSTAGRPAEELLEGWLAGDGAAGRLMMMLWSPQHDLEQDPTQVFPTPSRGQVLVAPSLLEQVLERARGPAGLGPFVRIQKLVAARYHEGFTPKDHRVKRGSELDLARRERDRADDARDELRQQRQRVEERIQEYQALLFEHEQECAEREVLREQMTGRRQALEDYRAKLQALHVAEARAWTLRETCERLQKDDLRIAGLVRQGLEAQEGRRRLVPALEQAGHRHATASEQLRRAEDSQRAGEPILDEMAHDIEALGRLTTALRSYGILSEAEGTAARAEQDAGEALAGAREDLAAANVALDRAQRTHATLEARRLRGALEAAERDLARAESAWSVAETGMRLSEWQHISETAQRVEALGREADALGDPAALGPRPSRDELNALAQAEASLLALEQNLAADALTFRLAASAPVSATLAVDGAPLRTLSVREGQAIETVAVSGLALVVEGLGRIEVGRTAASPTDRLHRREALRRDLHARLEHFRAESLEILRRREDTAEERGRILGRIGAALGGETLEALQARRDDLAAWFRERGGDPATERAVPCPAAAELDRLRHEREAARERRAQARARLEAAPAGMTEPAGLVEEGDIEDDLDHTRAWVERAGAALAAAETRRIQTSAQRAIATQRRQEAERTLRQEAHGDEPQACVRELRDRVDGRAQSLVPVGVSLAVPEEGPTRGALQVARRKLIERVETRRADHEQIRRDLEQLERQATELDATCQTLARTLVLARDEVPLGHDDEVRAAAVRAAERDAIVAEARAEELRVGLPPDPATLDDLAERLERVETACRRREDLLNETRGELNATGAHGLDSQLAEAVERCDRAAARHDRAWRDAAAWALLHHLLAEVEADQARGVAARLEELVAGTVPRLTGQNVGAIALDPRTLAPLEARRPRDDVGRCIERFSRGTREQVALACRLEIGRLLGRRTRHMLLLDDPLAHTDPARHREALAVLAELAESLQILIFTCHRDRYAELWEEKNGRRIDLGVG